MGENENEGSSVADVLSGVTQCRFCAGVHDIVRGVPAWQQPCPRIKRIEFYDGGHPSAIEFWEPGSGWDDSVVFPSQLVDEEDEDAG